MVNFENLIGTRLADTLRGDVNANAIDAKDGADAVYGMGGNDTLSGGAGNDVMDGGDGADTIYGGDGVDTLTGGLGADHRALPVEARGGRLALVDAAGRTRAEASGRQQGIPRSALAHPQRPQAGGTRLGEGVSEDRELNEGQV